MGCQLGLRRLRGGHQSLEMPLTFMPMLSPGSAIGIVVWCISIDLTSAVLLDGMKTRFCAWFEYACFDSADWDCADAGDAVDVLDWNTEWFVGWFCWEFE